MTGPDRRQPGRAGLRRLAALTSATLLVGLAAVAAQAQPAQETGPAAVEQRVWAQLAAAETADFWVYLRAEASLAAAEAITDRAEQGRFVYRQLTRTATGSQAGLRAMLDAADAPYQPFWIANTVRVTGDAALLKRIAALPEVEQVTADRSYQLPTPVQAEANAEPTVQGVEWNIDRINAPRVWDTFGATGQGVVVGTIDSGAQHDHPALVGQYRGNLGGGQFDHAYNWHDPSQVCPSPAPCDNEGHGTHVAGTIVGDDGGDNQIGVAPGAQWIAAKGCESRSCSQQALLSSGQFMLAPTDLSGGNPDPARRPHVVNNSWGGGPTTDPWYRPTVQAWVAAGIFPQFAAGNTTSGVAPCGSASNPGNLPDSYAAGAFGPDDEIANFSNRGPSVWASDLVKPNIAAPGANIRSSVPGNGYQPNNGTSMASPHVAGAVALLWSAAPALVRDVDATREALDRTAVDTEDLSCGGEPGNDNVWGEGRLDVFAAVDQAPRGPSGRLTGTVSDAGTDAPIAGATIAISGQDRDRTTGPDGTYSVVLSVGEYQVTASAFGYHPRTVEFTVAEDRTTAGDIELQPVDTVTISGLVTDGSGHGWPMYAKVDVSGTPVRTFTDPMTGRYRLTLPAGGAYTLRVQPQYPGYAEITEAVDTAGGDVTLDLAPTVDSCDQAPGYAPGDGGECGAVDGGLVLGHVTDANTGDPVNGATVTSADHRDDAGSSAATPDDPAIDDGFYWLFSSRTGSTRFTATAGGYADQDRTADVGADATSAADFVLDAGRLAVDRTELTARLRLGESADRTFTVANTGTAPAAIEVGQLPGSFEILDAEPAPRGQRWRAPAGLAPNPKYDPDSPTTKGQYQQGSQSDPTPSAPGEVITSWAPADMLRAWGVGFDRSADGRVWLSDAVTGNNHAFSPDGSATGARHATPWTAGWPADMALLGEDEMCQVGVGNEVGIYCWNTGSGELGRSITGSFPWTALSQRGLGYRADDDTFYIGGWNQNVLYQVRGFGHDTPGEVVHQCAFPGMGISGLAWNPTAELLWVATNTAADNIYLVDPDECLVLDSIGHPRPGYNGAGLHLDHQGNLWLVSQGHELSESMVYLVESGVPDVSDVPWLEPSPAEVTLAPGDRVTVTVSMDSGATAQRQPGTYAAGLLIGHQTPYPVDRVSVTMEVTPPNDWGRVSGTVAGLDCAGAQHVPAGAAVQVDGRFLDTTLTTYTGGRYTYWAHVRNNPLQLEASARGYLPHSQSAPVIPRRGAVADFALQRADEFGYACAPEDAEYEQADTVLPITGRNATRTIDLPFPFPFYGVTYTRAHICSNGYIEFAGPSTSFPIGCSFPTSRIPSQARPNAAIYAFRDPALLVDAEASIRADGRGAAPSRRLVIEFRNIGFADGGDPDRRIDFNVVLHENGDVLTQYRDIADNPRERGGAASIGIEDHTGTIALEHSFDELALPSGSGATSMRYQPPPPGPPEPSPESWTARYNGPDGGDDIARATRVSPDGSRVFVTGYGPGDGTGSDFATVAYDASTGDQLWSTRYNGPANGGDFARAVDVNPDGSRVFVTGYSAGDGTGDDYATVAYDAATGDQLWAARYDGPVNGGDQAYALAVSPDGSHVFVTGRSIGDATSFDYATVAYDAVDGTQSWAARYDGPVPAYGFDQAFAVGVSPDSAQVYVTGQSQGEGTNADYATVAYDVADGAQSWVSRYDGPANGADVGWALGVSADGVFVTGQSEDGASGEDYATVGYDLATGDELWVARYDGPRSGTDIAWALGVSPDGSRVFVTGQSQGDGGGLDYATVGYDRTSGDEVWVARYNGPSGGSDVASALGVSADGVFVTGRSAGDTGDAFTTVGYDPATGDELWNHRYAGPISGHNTARALTVSRDGAQVYVSGDGPGEAGLDAVTVAYPASPS